MPLWDLLPAEIVPLWSFAEFNKAFFFVCCLEWHGPVTHYEGTFDISSLSFESICLLSNIITPFRGVLIIIRTRFFCAYYISAAN